MKKLIFIISLTALPAIAGTPSTNCPAGYFAIQTQDLIATECPSGTADIGRINSCLSSNPSSECYMFAPVGMSFTDDSGTYEFTDVCPME